MGLGRAHMVMAYVVMAYIVTAHIVMAYVVMAYVVMAYIVTAHIVMGLYANPLGIGVWSGAGCLAVGQGPRRRDSTLWLSLSLSGISVFKISPCGASPWSTTD